MLSATSSLLRGGGRPGPAARASSRQAHAPAGRAPAPSKPTTSDRRPAAAAVAARAADGESSGGGGPVASPFSSDIVARGVGVKAGAPKAAAAAAAPLTTLSVEAVDACLDEVRPYLIADGGDVEVVSAEPSPPPGRVSLRLRGACSSCSSSDATMKMGLERAIRARFGAGVLVVQEAADSGGGAGGDAGGGPPRATQEAVDGHLNMLRGAVKGLGGRVRVAEVALIPDREGKQRALVWYKGPRSIGNGIKAAILERFPGDVVEVALVDYPPGEE